MHPTPRPSLPPGLQPHEVIARLTIDLDADGRFTVGQQLLLTASALWHGDSGGGWQAIPLGPRWSLRHTDLAGVATLDLRAPEGLRAR